MALKLEQDGSRFRVLSQGYCTVWLPDTSANRKSMVVFLCLLEDENGEPLHTYQELAAVAGSSNRQASRGHMEDFRACGQDMLAFLQRRRKVAPDVVQGVLSELLVEPQGWMHCVLVIVGSDRAPEPSWERTQLIDISGE